MTQIEKNIIYSFSLAKKDIIQLQRAVIDLRKSTEAMQEKINKLGKKPAKKVVKKVVKKVAKKITFVAAKDGKKFHRTTCPFARNIKPKSKVKFKSKNTALNNGYKPCSCI